MRIRTKLGLGVGVQILLSAILGISTIFGLLAVQRQFSFVVEHDSTVMANARHLSKLVIDMETGQRGFCITHQEDYLEPYVAGKRDFDRVLKEQMALVGDHPAQMALLRRIEKLVGEWKLRAAQPEIALARQAGLHEADVLNFQKILEAGDQKNLVQQFMALTMEIEMSFTDRQDWEAAFLIESLERCMTDREDGLRGYLITGDKSNLNKYTEREGAVRAYLHRLKSLMGRRDAEMRDAILPKLVQLERLATDWSQTVAWPEIAARANLDRHSRTQEDVAALVEAGVGKSLLDDIRREFDRFIEMETQLASQHYNSASQTAVSTRNFAASLLLAAIALGIAVAYLVSRSISRPIAQLAKVTELIGAGNLDAQIPADQFSAHTSDEIAILAERFNTMSANLKQADQTQEQSQRRLSAAHAELQSQIVRLGKAKLTAELSTADAQRVSIELQRSETRLKNILETASDGIVIITKQGIVDSYNEAAAEMFGYSADEVIGNNVSMLMDQPNSDDHDGYLSHYLQTGERRVIGMRREVEGKRKDGELFPMELAVSEVHTDSAHLFTAIVRDLTARQQLQMELAQAQKLESVGQLAAGIAHEINTPTQYVSDNTSFLRDAFSDINTVLEKFDALLIAAKQGTVDDAHIQEVESALQQADMEYLSEEIPAAIEQSLDGVERVAKIVRAMKEFSHPGSDEKSLVDITKAIETTITVAHNEWKYIATMETDFDPELPEVLCLPGELNQVFLNMIVNAAHAIEDGRSADGIEQGTITISAHRRDNWAEITIRDTGTGIPEHVRARMFDPFYTTKDVGRGTGQGLAITRSVIVDKHNGTIDCKTEPGKGTTFIIRLPISGEQHTLNMEGAGDACTIC